MQTLYMKPSDPTVAGLLARTFPGFSYREVKVSIHDAGGMGLPAVDGYDAAATSLEAVGCYRDGMPAGQTWRTAAKLSDADLLAGLPRREAAFYISAGDLIEYGF